MSESTREPIAPPRCSRLLELGDLDAALEPDRLHPPCLLPAGGRRHPWIRR
jgi:hypothetical protein